MAVLYTVSTESGDGKKEHRHVAEASFENTELRRSLVSSRVDAHALPITYYTKDLVRQVTF